jgi:hypothetical protein
MIVMLQLTAAAGFYRTKQKAACAGRASYATDGKSHIYATISKPNSSLCLCDQKMSRKCALPPQLTTLTTLICSESKMSIIGHVPTFSKLTLNINLTMAC